METIVQNLNIHYELFEPKSSEDKPLVLFLHGWGTSGASFGKLLSTVSEAYMAIAPDLPGFGASDEPAKPWNVDQYVDFILDFVKNWNPKKVILIAHSFGGRISIKLASRSGLPFSVEKMIFFDAAGILPKRGIKYKLKVGTYKLGKAILSWKPVKWIFPNALDEFKAGKGSSDYASASPIMKQTLVKTVNEDLTQSLPKISSSTLLIWGEKDTATPLSDGKKMEQLIPDAGLVVIPNAGHFSFLERPDICEQGVRNFLEIR